MDIRRKTECCTKHKLSTAMSRPNGCSLSRWKMELKRRERESCGIGAPEAEKIVEVQHKGNWLGI